MRPFAAVLLVLALVAGAHAAADLSSSSGEVAAPTGAVLIARKVGSIFSRPSIDRWL